MFHAFFCSFLLPIWHGMGGRDSGDWKRMSKMNLTDLPQTFYPKRSSTIMLFLGSASFVAIGIWLGISGEPMGYLCAAFFGLCLGVAIVQLIPGSSYLTLTCEGFEFAAMFRRSFIAWEDATEFGVTTMRSGGLAVNRMVGFNYTEPAKRASGRSLAKALAGFEGGLPDCYGFKALELAEMMERLRAERAGWREANPQSRSAGL